MEEKKDENADGKLNKKAAKKLAAEMLKWKQRKDRLVVEKTLDKETLKVLKNKWFGILLQSKLPEMKENLRSVLDYMEKLVEVEVYRKRLFEEERWEANEQINFQAQSHSSAMDKLYELYLQRIQDLHQIYTEQVLEKKLDAELEFEKMDAKEAATEENLKAILFQMEINEQRKEDAMQCEMFLRTDDEKSKNAEKSENLRMRLEKTMEKRWYQISSTLADYQQSTEHRRNHYMQLKARDKTDSKIIHAQMKKTQKLYDQIQQLKNYLENVDATDSKMTQIADYREERAKFYDSFVYLKQVMAEEMKLDDTNLKDLIALTNNVLEYLKYFQKKGEKILTLYTLCLKMETEKEKVVPVGRTLYTVKVPDSLENKIQAQANHEFITQYDADAQRVNLISDFEFFWQKVGRVRLSMLGLSQCIETLASENETLKKILHSYFVQVAQR